MDQKVGNQNFSNFIQIWNEVILGSKSQYDLDLTSIIELKSYLSRSLYDQMDNLLVELEIDVDLEKQNDKFLQNIVDIFSDIDPHDHGFYPAGIRKYKGLTCAGSAMIVSYLLDKKGIEHFYARPVGHSVNIIYHDDEFTWFDAHNGVYASIDCELKEFNAVKYLMIETKDEKIDYRLAILLDPTDTYYQIFGNLEHLKEIKDEDLTEEQIQILSEIDLNLVNSMLFPAVRRFMRGSGEYQTEVRRKRE